MLFVVFILVYGMDFGLAADPSTRIVLPQGVLTGVRMETGRKRGITAYRGIPYALPPIGALRFAPPEKHPGWNESLVAEDFRPDCLQPRDPNDEDTISEDCLYLNVFVPESDVYPEFPVIIFIDGEHFVTSSPSEIPAQELASEYVIVVTVSYRLSVFGFLNFGNTESRGNFGLLDQYLAMLWVQENIQYFRGSPKNVTLIGHGAGAAAVMAHLTSPRTTNMFQRIILMSGTIYSPIYHPESTIYTSIRIARSLGCYQDNASYQNFTPILTCMRQKPSQEILRAFENIYRIGNWTVSLVPTQDSFLPPGMQYLPENPIKVLQAGNSRKIPIMIGITSNEGSLLLDHWNDLRRQEESQVLDFIEQTALKNILQSSGHNSLASLLSVRWRYLQSSTQKKLEQLLQMYTHAMYEGPFWKTLNDLAKTNSQLFAYIFSHYTFGLDYYQNITRAGHGTDLCYLFGPSLFRKKARRRMRLSEDRLSLRMKELWFNFALTGHPYPYRFTAFWDPYESQLGNYLDLFNDEERGITLLPRIIDDGQLSTASFWNELLPALDKVTETVDEELILDKIMPYPGGECTSYRNAMLTTISFLLILLASLILVLVLLKRRTKERDRGIL